MKKLIAFILIAALIVGWMGFSAKNAISGSWNITLDMSNVLVSKVEMLSGIPVENIQVHYILTFHGNNIYTFRLDRERMAEELPRIREAIGCAAANAVQDSSLAMLESMLSRIGVDTDLTGILSDRNLSLENLLNLIFQLTGYSFDDLLTGALDDEMLTGVFAAAETSGSYLAFAGMLFLSDAPEKAIDLEKYVSYAAEDGTLVISDGTLNKEDLPLTFSR